MTEGIDVSKFQGIINFRQVRAADVRFVMIRASIGSYTADPLFTRNAAAAAAAGLNWGAYHYFYSKTVPEALAEAEFFLSRLKGLRPTFPVALDAEEPSLLSAGREALTDAVEAFLTKVQSAGYYVTLYANLNWLQNYLNFQQLRRFDVWLAQWGPAPTFQEAPIGMWQYTSEGTVPGVSGRVDRDRAFKDYPAIIRAAGLNGFPPKDDPNRLMVGDAVEVVGKIYPSADGGKGVSSYFSTLYITEILSGKPKPYRLSYKKGGATSGFAAAADLRRR